MNTRNRSEGFPDPQNPYLALARWLQQILATTPRQSRAELTSIIENGGQLGDDYHLSFYQQLPDFVTALLTNDPQATLHYAPLFYHLIGCNVCHKAYLEIYDAMRAALTTDGNHTAIDQGAHPITSVPPRMLAYLCQLLISQARAVLRQAHLDHTNNDAWARSLLQQAIRISSHIMQGSARQQALRDLVEVATLYTQEQTPAAHSYTPLIAAGNGTRHGKTRRGAGMLEHPAEAVLALQSGSLEGEIRQVGDTLELYLADLDEHLRGHHLLISLPLGSLLEPVRWLGGNPLAIRSQSPVDEKGRLRTPLGKTDLRLSNLEDHNLLEALFRKLDVRPAD